MKSWLKKKMNPQAPRPLPEIQEEYQQLLAQVANAQYLVFVHTKEQARFNGRLLELNQEAAKRNTLDAETKAAEAKAKPTAEKKA